MTHSIGQKAQSQTMEGGARAIDLGSATAMAARQRDISVSEFFPKNRHLLGFDSPHEAILTTVKEAVDNALDACEETGIRELTPRQRDRTVEKLDTILHRSRKK